MTQEEAEKTVDNFIKRNILTGVDQGLRRAVEMVVLLLERENRELREDLNRIYLADQGG